MHEILVLANRLGGLSLPRSVVRLTDRPDMTLDVYRGRKTTTQQQHCDVQFNSFFTFLHIVNNTRSRQRNIHNTTTWWYIKHVNFKNKEHPYDLVIDAASIEKKGLIPFANCKTSEQLVALRVVIKPFMFGSIHVDSSVSTSFC